MIAIILENNEEYVSPVFAIRNTGNSSEVLAFNRERTHIARIKMWYPSRKVFIVQWEGFDCKRGAWEGYEWVINNKDLWKSLRFGRQANIENFPDFKNYTQTITLPEWFEIKDDADIQSLMWASMGFHDSILTKIDTSGDQTQIEFDTTWGCIITVKFQGVLKSELVDNIGIIYDSVIKKTDDGFIWQVTCFESGEVGGVVDFLPVQGEPCIVCNKIEWGIKIGKSGYCSQTKQYTGLYDFYCDLKSVNENVFMKDDKLILNHKDDTLVIEWSGDCYRTYLNGKRERMKWEEQDVFEYASDFLTQLNPEDIDEEVLADVTSVKKLYIWHYLKYAALFSVLWSALGLLLVFLANMNWVLWAVLFLALSLYILFLTLWSSVKAKIKRYIITPTKIYYFCASQSNQVLNFSEIKHIRLHHSFIKKGVGTITIKQKGVVTFGYGLIAVNEAEKVYNIISQSLHKVES